MKKILLATTMLTATVGAASAEMTVTGSARLGLQANWVPAILNSDGTTDTEGQVLTAFNSRFRINFTGSGTTDGGLTFGASARADQAGAGISQNANNELTVGGGANGNRWMNAGTVYLAGTFGTITMGDTGNAADDLVGQVAYVGYTSLNSWNEIGNLDRYTTGVEYSYSANGLTFALGAGQTFDAAAAVGADHAADSANFWAAGVKYATDAFSVALGYQTNDAGDIISFMGTYTVSGVGLMLKIADDSRYVDTEYALSATYNMNGVGLTGYYNSDTQGWNGSGQADTTMSGAYGIGASYDLGGGASVVGGIAQRNGDGYGSVFDLGVLMSF